MTISTWLFPPRAAAPLPRGLAPDGPALLSYGFRPFFLGAGVWAILAMALWIGALTLGWPVGGTYGSVSWHAHEMLFGYATGVLAGFMLTAVPNWTGRLPLSGQPLLMLFGLWLAGRVAMLVPDLLAPTVAVVIDATFIPALAMVAGREIIAGRNWKNLKILLALVALSFANILFHAAVLSGADSAHAYRFAIATLVMLIAVVGGRIVPSFTRNWLVKRSLPVPASFDWVDQAALTITALALASWVLQVTSWAIVASCSTASVLQAWRLWRWGGRRVMPEPIIVILHLGYAFIPLGLLAFSTTALGLTSDISALHVVTVGAIGTMTLAVMSRATLGHTGRPIVACTAMRISYAAIFAAAVIRPSADAVDWLYYPVLAFSGGLWVLAFSAFLVSCGPMLVTPRVRG